MQNEISDAALNLAKELISFPSTKDNPEARGQVLERAAQSLPGFTRERFESKGVRSDLYYSSTSRPDKFRVLFHAHLDVVPAQNPSQYIPKVEKGKLVGRGASDMKSGAAVMIEVFRRASRDLPYPVGLSLTTDEEIGGFNGAGYQVEQGVMADFVISGESTNLKIGNEHKGVIILELSATTKGGHTAYDGDGDNALLRVLRVQSEATRMYPGPDGVWRTTCSPTITSTRNLAHNVVPSDASGELAFRWIAKDNPDVIQERIAKIDPQVRVIRGPFGLAHLTPENHPDLRSLAQVIKSVTHKEAKFHSHAGASDVRHWTEKGAAGIDFGLHGEGLHTETEHAFIESFGTYAEVLLRFLTKIR